jgi:hypothetical protein
MSIIIKGNRGEYIGGDFIRADVSQETDIHIEDNAGKNVVGSIVNLNIRENPSDDALNGAPKAVGWIIRDIATGAVADVIKKTIGM